MQRVLRTAILFFCLSGLGQLVLAQQYGYIQYNSESGAPFDQVSTIMKDQEGFIWVGSEQGLYRFDGVNFDLYSVHSQSQYIQQIHRADEKY